MKSISKFILPKIITGLFIAPLFAADVMPKIFINEPSHNFGKMVQGDVRSHVFFYENRGGVVLKILKVTSSCGCTTGRPSKKELKPGEKGELKITFDSAKFHGRQHKSVTMNTNDSENPFVKFTFTADVKRVWSFEPSYIKFTATKDGRDTQEKVIELKIKNLHDVPINYINLETGMQMLTFNKTFPVTHAGIKPGSVFSCNITPAINEKIKNTKYGHMEIKVIFEGGRTFKKRLGASIKKYRPKTDK
jgi:hypothetical protein